MTPRPPDARGGPIALEPIEEGPPAARPRGIFGIEGRPAPGLYVVAWLLSAAAAALLLVGFLTDLPAAKALLLFGGLVALAAGLGCAAGYQLLARGHRPVGAYRGPSPLILFGIVATLTLIVVGPLFALGLVGLTTVGALVQLLVIAVGYVLVVWLFVVRSGALSWRDMRRPPGVAELRIGHVVEDVASAVALMAPANLALSIAGGLVALALDVRPTSPLPNPQGTIDTVALVLAAVIVAPIGEEIFFRGFALTAWRRDLGARSALIRSSVFFALVHLANLTASTAREGLLLAVVAVLVYVPLGFLLGWLFQRRGLLASISGHAASNATALLLVAAAGSGGGAT